MKRIKYIKDLHNLSNDIKQTVKDCEKECKRISDYIATQDLLFVLGKEDTLSIAYEGALKIKELTYVNAQGYGGNSLRHGPYAVIKKGTPIIFVSPNNEHMTHMKNTMEEVYSRNAVPICITDYTGKIPKCDNIIKVKSNDSFSGILHNIPLQLIAYYTALKLGNTIDKPINLAKCVSV